MIRGDLSEVERLTAAHDVAVSAGLDTDAEVASLVADASRIEPIALSSLQRLAAAGGWVLVEQAIADLPTDLRWLLESGAVTLNELATLHQSLDIVTAADIACELQRRSIERLPDGDALARALADVLPTLRASVARIPLGRAVAIAEPILERLRAVPGVLWATAVGSLRRGQDFVGDIELIAPALDPTPILHAATALPQFTGLRHAGARRVYFSAERTEVGVRCPSPGAAGATLLFLTGSRAHVDMLVQRAAARGLVLDRDALHTIQDRRAVASSEEEIYAALDLPFIPPEIRNGDDEIPRAAARALPRLVERADLRGDLHMHTSWSDGRDSVDEMVAEAARLGYEYIAITDHSPHSSASRSLTLEGVSQQADEIARARERFPGITILHGCEVDILPNGRLDFPDRVLRQFDIVLASLHDAAGHGPQELLTRYLSAMVHPLVTIITHPTNRYVPGRDGYALSYARLFEAAVETRTVLEIDGGPSHLDLPGYLARQAVEAGALVSIDSDCHRTEMLGRQMDLGVLTARRGWVEPRHVLNARSIQEVRAHIAAKRRRT